ncbi:MAG: peptidoglycan-binding protein [Roseibium sp.]|nr:peptidoglycan-binding protein [Roseibium sp.]
MARRRGSEPKEEMDGLLTRTGGAARDNPVTAGGALVMLLTGCLIIANALGLQATPHPAPLFATRDRPMPVDAPDALDVRDTQVQEISALVLDLQTELRRQGFYEGPLDGVNGPATERAIRHYERKLGRKETGEATEALLALVTLQKTAPGPVLSRSPIPRPKPARGGAIQAGSALPTPDPRQTVSQAAEPVPPRDIRLARIQEILSDLGYGPLSADGVMGDNTSAAIKRFELDRGLPLTGQPSAAVVDRLEMVSGLSIDG